jgi:hypothetical protein
MMQAQYQMQTGCPGGIEERIIRSPGGGEGPASWKVSKRRGGSGTEDLPLHNLENVT